MLWSSFATAKLNASIGFHEIAFEAKFRVVLARGIDVRRSYSTIDRSVAADARMEVSIWLKDTLVIVSVELGHFNTSGGALLFSKSYIEITPEEAAKAFLDRWCETLVKAFVPSQVAVGAAFTGVLYGSKSLTVRSAAQVNSLLSLVQHIPLTIFS